MNRLISFITLAILSSTHLLAREITGKVIDIDSIPMEFVSVVVFSNDSVVGGGTTNIDGCFKIDVSNKFNRIRFSFMGYHDVNLNASQPNCGTIVLKPNVTMLSEVVVKAPLIVRETDRIVLNISSNPLSANKNARELLKTAPGVWISDNSLSIYGQSGTTIYIDDRKINLSGTQLMTYLKTIQSSSIKTIEIIPKTGAEYSADLSGGIIRINLKRNRIDGVNGSVGINTTIGKYKQWFNPFANISTHFGKWTINSSGNLNGSPSEKYSTNEKSSNSQNLLFLNGVSHHTNKSLQGNLMFGVFFEPSNKNRFGVQIDYNANHSKNNSISQTELVSNEFYYTTCGNYINDDHYNNININFNWAHTFDEKGSMLKLISAYNYQNSSAYEDNKMSRSTFPTDSLYRIDNYSNYNILTTELSLHKVLNLNWKFNVGIKHTLNDIAYKSLHYLFDNSEWFCNNNYNYYDTYNENIIAVFASIYGHLGRWKLKTGIRGEYFNTTGDINNSKFDLFPNVNLSYQITEHGDYSIGVGYYRNIRRPSFVALNPTVRQTSDYSYSVGNPNLKQSYNNSISLDILLAGKFTIATGFSQSDKPIRQMFKSNPEYPERIYLTWDNNGCDRNLFIHGDGGISVTKWWNLYASATYMITSQQIENDSAFDTFGYLQLFTSSTILLPKGFNISLNCFYNTKMKIGNITVFPILNLEPTIQKQFDKWSISLSAENILQRNGKIRTFSSGYDRLTYTKSHLAIKLGITYNFNSGKVFKSQRIESNTDNSRFSKE